ncbi:MAG: TMEM175 family protein [Treponema sp.]|nr:TMEM175 family protein [Treponema sp.]
MEYPKHRFEFFSDGLMAIVMTIMVLEITVSREFSFENIEEFLQSILIFFVSFFIVGWFMNKHHYLIRNTKTITGKIAMKNLVFLFFVALIPAFTKMVIENNASTITVLAYNTVFVLANLSFLVLGIESRRQLPKEEWHMLFTTRIRYHRHSYLRVFVGVIILLGLAAMSIVFTKLSMILYIIFPVAFALLNIFIERGERCIKRKKIGENELKMADDLETKK